MAWLQASLARVIVAADVDHYRRVRGHSSTADPQSSWLKTGVRLLRPAPAYFVRFVVAVGGTENLVCHARAVCAGSSPRLWAMPETTHAPFWLIPACKLLSSAQNARRQLVSFTTVNTAHRF